MAAIDDSTTYGRASLSFSRVEDIDEFAETLGKFERGEITPDQWRVFRLVRGTYGQRQPDDSHMVRVKIPQGILSAAQLGAIADVTDRYSRGFAHITTRQNIQLHFVPLGDVEAAMRDLAEHGLTTKEACGNSVRNVTACPYAGVSGDEVFDITPYAEALTRYFLRHPLSGVLPRKFKIGFEGCRHDHVKAAINDLGFRARIVDGRHGFQLLVGGGTAILCTSGNVLFDFLPADEMLDAAEAVVRVFHTFGDFKHKHRNRLKFLIKSMGWEAFRAEFAKAFADVRAWGGTPLPFDPEHPPVEAAPDWERPTPPTVRAIANRALAARLRGPGIHPVTTAITVTGETSFAAWARTNVRPQKQAGFIAAVVTVPLGDLTSEQFRLIGDLALAFGDGAVRVTPVQDVVLRWVPGDRVRDLFDRLAAAGLGLGGADTVADVTSCPGAESCKLAVTQSRGLGRTIETFLRARPDLVAGAPGVDIKMSGCPNGCGQHHIAGIGFQGSLRKVGDQAAPQYFVLAGGGVGGDAAHFGRVVAKVPAHRATAALERLLTLYADERRADDTSETFFGRQEVARLKTLLGDLEVLTPQSATAEDFIDLGETTVFRPETMDGECAV
jgi:sulfite reductase (NADPH) hemoprotein beta-component